jgi:hypothetical protein
MNGHYIGGLLARIARLNVRGRRLNDRARGDADRRRLLSEIAIAGGEVGLGVVSLGARPLMRF